MPTTPSGFGIPGGPPIDFGQFGLLWTLVALILLVVSASALWLMRVRRPRRYHLPCPHHGTTAVITVQRSEDGAATVTHCSLCHPPDRVECDQRCRRQVA